MLLSSLIFASIALAKNFLDHPAPQPARYPLIIDPDGLIPLGKKFLREPLVRNAVAYIKSVVPEDLLSEKSWELPDGVEPDVVNCHDGTVAITFDDGPTFFGEFESNTRNLLDTLDKVNIKATFFVLGCRVNRFPEILSEIYNRGHEIGIHTYSHSRMSLLSVEELVAEFRYSEAIIFKTIGVKPKLFRPPFGDTNNKIRAIANALGYKTVMWSHDSRDAVISFNETYRDDPASHQEITNRVLNWFRSPNSFISLHHDLNPYAVDVAGEYLPLLTRADVARTRTVSQCIAYRTADQVKSYEYSQTSILPNYMFLFVISFNVSIVLLLVVILIYQLLLKRAAPLRRVFLR